MQYHKKNMHYHEIQNSNPTLLIFVLLRQEQLCASQLSSNITSSNSVTVTHDLLTGLQVTPLPNIQQASELHGWSMKNYPDILLFCCTLIFFTIFCIISSDGIIIFVLCIHYISYRLIIGCNKE